MGRKPETYKGSIPSKQFPDELRDQRKTGWFWMFNQVFDMGLSVYAIAVYTYLCRKARGNVAMPSIREMASVLGVKKRYVEKALRELEQKGMIRKEQVKVGNAFLNNRYILTDIEEWNFEEVSCKEGCPKGQGVLKDRVSYKDRGCPKGQVFASSDAETVEAQGENETNPPYRTTIYRTTNRTTNKDYSLSLIESECESKKKNFVHENLEEEDLRGSLELEGKKAHEKVEPAYEKKKPSAFKNSAGAQARTLPEAVRRWLLKVLRKSREVKSPIAVLRSMDEAEINYLIEEHLHELDPEYRYSDYKEFLRSHGFKPVDIADFLLSKDKEGKLKELGVYEEFKKWKEEKEKEEWESLKEDIKECALAMAKSNGDYKKWKKDLLTAFRAFPKELIKEAINELKALGRLKIDKEANKVIVVE